MKTSTSPTTVRLAAAFVTLAGLRHLILLAGLWIHITAHAGSETALSFNGAAQRVRIPDFFTNAPTTEVTVEFWQVASGLRAQSSFSQDDASRGGNDGINIFNAHVPYSDGVVYWDFGQNSGEGRLAYTPPASIVGSWQHFAFVASQSGNFMRIYRNGVLEAEKTGMTPFTRGRFNLDLGGENNHLWQVSFTGILDEFRIWDVARTEAEIQSAMYQPLSLPQPNLLAYWPFDEGGGEVARDASGNGRHGILINGPVWVTPDLQQLRIEAIDRNVAVGFVTSFLARNTGPMVQTTWEFGDGAKLTNQLFASHAWSAPGVYTVRLTGYNGSHPDGVTTTATVTVSEQVAYVDAANSAPVFPYTTWVTAATNIQDAILASTVPGRLVLVTNGVYRLGATSLENSGWSRVVLTNRVLVKSVNGPDVTVIQGGRVNSTTGESDAVRCAWLGENSLLSGFRLTGGQAVYGGGAYCQPLGVLTNCVVVANDAGNGGGVCGGTLYNCTLTGNTAQSGGGVYGGTVHHCTLIGNSARFGGGGAYESTLSNCELKDNWAGEGGAAAGGVLRNCTLIANAACGYIWTGMLCSSGWSAGTGGGVSGANLFNCTVTGNRAARGGGVSQCSVYNSIVISNTAPTQPNWAELGDEHRIEYTCTTPLPPGAGNLDADPRFATCGHLSSTSPCIRAGSPTHASGVDLDGEPWADPPCIGADQLTPGQAAGSLSMEPRASYTRAVVGFPVEFEAWNQGSILASVWDLGDGLVLTNQPTVRRAWSDPGSHSVRLTGYSDSHPEGVSTILQVEVVKQATHYVNASNPTPVPPFASWATAATNIQDAIEASAVAGRLVLVTNGVFRSGTIERHGLNRVALTGAVVVQSVNGPEATVIEGDRYDLETGEGESVRCAYVGADAVLSGFTLTKGTTMNTDAEGRGGGAWCEPSGVLTNCVLIANTSRAPGGGVYQGRIYNSRLLGNTAAGVYRECHGGSGHGGGLGGGSAYGTLHNCILSDNRASAGGGAYAGSLYNCLLTGNSCRSDDQALSGAGGGVLGATLYNCVLTGNSAYEGGAVVGGYLWNPSWPACVLYNCTLTRNLAVYDGGVRGGLLYNCIVYDNSSEESPSWPNYGGDSVFQFCCTWPLPEGPGNIALPPAFVDPGAGDFRLRPDSPCIDAGMNLVGFATTVTNEMNGEVFTIAYDGDATGILGLPPPLDGNGDGVAHFDMGAYEFNPYRFAPVVRPGPNGFSLTIQGEPGKTVRVERSRDLVSWELAFEVPIPAGGQKLIDPAAVAERMLFYRAVGQ